MREINGIEYSDEELRNIYRFFTNTYGGPSEPSYSILRKVGFDRDSKECTDLEAMYKELGEYKTIMNETDGTANELAVMYRAFKRCLPQCLDKDGEPIATWHGLQLKELEDCDDQEIVESIQKMYDKYMKAEHDSFMESLRKIMRGKKW